MAANKTGDRKATSKPRKSDPMAKYYVQSGTLRCVVSAENPRRAALWAVHRAMQQIMPIDETTPTLPEDKTLRAKEEGVMVLSGTISTSERGYGSNDAETMPTFDVVTEWNQLVNALDRLETMFSRD
jgi:hypothetical protein